MLGISTGKFVYVRFVEFNIDNNIDSHFGRLLVKDAYLFLCLYVWILCTYVWSVLAFGSNTKGGEGFVAPPS